MCKVMRNLATPWFSARGLAWWQMMRLVQDKQPNVLDQFNQYSPWSDVHHEGCSFSIFSAACPIEPLYSLENGIILDCLIILFKDDIHVPQEAKLDRIVRHLVLLPHQHFACPVTKPCMPHLLHACLTYSGKMMSHPSWLISLQN